jgi:HPt (histidine-containing phosphotransfer) domain-containing protein
MEYKEIYIYKYTTSCYYLPIITIYGISALRCQKAREVSMMRGIVTPEMFECIPEIDYNIGNRFFLGNMDNYTKALLSTLKSIKSKLPILQSMIISDEYEGLRTITQTLNKMLSNIGASVIAEATYQLEMILLNEDQLSIQDQLSNYILDLVELSEHLEVLLKKMDIKNTIESNNDQPSFLNYDFTKTKESIKLSSNLLERKII